MSHARTKAPTNHRPGLIGQPLLKTTTHITAQASQLSLRWLRASVKSLAESLSVGTLLTSTAKPIEMKTSRLATNQKSFDATR